MISATAVTSREDEISLLADNKRFDMLILSRRNGETVVVGGGGGLQRVLKITVLQIASDRVKLGFEVDGDIPVHRDEVWQRMCANDELPVSTDNRKST